MFRKKIWTFLFLALFGVIVYGSPTQNNTDYKNWSMQELLFSINNDLLNPTDKAICIEYYLQKAKEENIPGDIINAYRKKVFLVEDFTLQSKYADSLLQFTLQINDMQAIGSAYNTMSYIEYVHKNYKKALEYGLQAEDYLKKTDDEYTLNKVKYAIGSIYYHLEDFDKSAQVTKESMLYYQSQLNDSSNAYNNLRGYISNIYALSKTSFRQQKNDTIKLLLQEGYQAAKKLKSKDRTLETAYFDLIHGMYDHRLQQYTSSDSLLSKALPPIQSNGDYANEHLVYLYLGKNAWDRGQKEKALSYFQKIETLYKESNFANTELSEAFNYLITYYQEKKDLEKELYYTKLLMELSSELHKNNSKLSSFLHTHLDTKKLEASKQKLEYELSRSQSQIKGLYALVTILIFIVFMGLVYYQKTQQKLQQQYKHLIQESPKHPIQLSQRLQQESVASSVSVEFTESQQPLNTTQVLIRKLEDFEQKKGYLQKITQDELARQFGTNRNTLSKFFNEEKNINFSDYLKHLRIQHAVRELTYNPKLHLLNLTGLADEFGFGSSKSFSNAFKEIAKISVTDFIKMRQQDEDFKDMDQSKSSI
ncbi:AraC family transcriptional regulator [Myroides sp. 1354]|uniref:helix-turn-helix domain-containing protein n=1 Tax=unclassified Myroides TaxID=2642485 RepID=UPI002574D03B|nr:MULTISPECIES: helix-turn-helix domain-containing protein [unclassified Myroides]MDM1043540.1 AraC family transcriptional regulator [Myroides sp. R163-1]MDM1054410.1 AraC family transcriptional regulator [Myroides sp. 1354]MDM1067706.1 AraC family transcriptional regulator [Myroides sp. 1372]